MKAHAGHSVSFTGRKLLRGFSIFILAALFFSFQNEPKSVPIYVFGTLQSIMEQGDLGAKIRLDTLKKRNLYALGSVENLKGEILIWDGKPCIASVQEQEVVVRTSNDISASLLVYAKVSRWSPQRLPGRIRTMADLENYVKEAAAEYGLDTRKPFPFIISGRPISAHWHVVNWNEGDREHTPEKHRNSGIRDIVFEDFIEILGFYSENHQGIFTHHSTKMHLHFRNQKRNLAGHLDDIKMVGNMMLYLPDVKKL